MKIITAICYYSILLGKWLQYKESVNRTLATNLHIKDKQYNCLYIIKFYLIYIAIAS